MATVTRARRRHNAAASPIAIRPTLSISCGAADITFSWIEEPCRSMLLARAALACRASKPACVANCAAKSVRPVQPRALQHRRLDLPDRAARRRSTERQAGRRGGAGDRARGGRAGAAARRRHLAMRPDRGARAGSRLQQVHGHCRRARHRGAARAGRSPAWSWSGSTRGLSQHKLWFPVDVSTGDRATIGGMTANNSCGARSIRYGNMVHNVRAIDAILADGTRGALRRGSRQFR